MTVGDLATLLTGLRLEPLGERPIRLPRGQRPPWVEELVASADAVIAGRGVAAVEQLLLRPVRTYSLRVAADERAFALLSPQAVKGEVPVLLAAIVTAAAESKKSLTDCGGSVLRSAPLQTEAARELLFEVALQLSPDALAARDPDGPPPTALIVGAPPRSADLLRRRLWAHGVRTEGVLEQPRRWMLETRRRLTAFHGDFALLLVAACGSDLGTLLAQVRPGTTPVLLEETDPDLLQLEVDERLDALSVDLRSFLAPGDQPSEPPDLAAGTRVLLSDAFVVTPRCLDSLTKCVYADSARMLDHLARLARLATTWRARRGDLGQRFEDWAAQEEGLDVAPGDDALRQQGLDRFQHEGRSHSRARHVKVDDAKPLIECGRIYFALDSEEWRFIVDHIGIHL
jgi:hypothetical protein